MAARILSCIALAITLSIASAVVRPIWVLAQNIHVTRVLPARCAVGQIAFRPDVTPGSNLFFCTAPNAWTQMAGVAGEGGGGGDANYSGAETPAGTIDGVNRVFNVVHLPITGSLQLFRNGLLQAEGLDFSLSDQTVTFTEVATPQPDDVLIAYYRY